MAQLQYNCGWNWVEWFHVYLCVCVCTCLADLCSLTRGGIKRFVWRVNKIVNSNIGGCPSILQTGRAEAASGRGASFMSFVPFYGAPACAVGAKSRRHTTPINFAIITVISPKWYLITFLPRLIFIAVLAYLLQDYVLQKF